MKNAFPHHSGGVVQVKHPSRYGVVPEARALEELARQLPNELTLIAAATKAAT